MFGTAERLAKVCTDRLQYLALVGECDNSACVIFHIDVSVLKTSPRISLESVDGPILQRKCPVFVDDPGPTFPGVPNSIMRTVRQPIMQHVNFVGAEWFSLVGLLCAPFLRGNAALELLDTVLARNGGHGLSAHTGAHAQIRGASSRIHGNLSCGLFVQNMFGDYRREERTTVTVSGLGSKPPARADDGYFKHYPSGRSTSTLFERTGDHPNTGHDIVEYGTGSVVFLE